MSAMRTRTLSKVNTWILRNEGKAGLAADEENDCEVSKGSMSPCLQTHWRCLQDLVRVNAVELAIETRDAFFSMPTEDTPTWKRPI